MTICRYRKPQQLSGKRLQSFLGKPNSTSSIPIQNKGHLRTSTELRQPLWHIFCPHQSCFISRFLMKGQPHFNVYPLVDTQQKRLCGDSLSVCQDFMSKSEPPRECRKNVFLILGSELTLKNFQKNLRKYKIPRGKVEGKDIIFSVFSVSINKTLI